MDMTSLLNRLIRLVETEGGSGARSRLQVASDTTEDLSQVADSLLGYFVDKARAEGRSWSDIGADMGLTKQGAQQRFSPSWATKLVGFSEHLSSRSQQTLIDSQKLAKHNGANRVSVDHVLCAVLMSYVDQFGSICSQEVRRQELAEAFNMRLAAESTSSRRASVRFSRPSMELMALAATAASESEVTLVDPAHFIAGAFDLPINSLQKPISSLGISWPSFQAEINSRT